MIDRIEFADLGEYDYSLDSVKGMNALKYAMAVAVAGRHNILAYGAPGCGKTITLQCMPQLMPKLLKDEAESVRRIYSLAGLELNNKARPFRMPHQSATLEGMAGGGPRCLPGEISLAHNGVLFIDEAAEFRASVLQLLRLPLENGQITLSRAGRTTVYPSKFQLVMATNPCPCGNYGSENRSCICSPHTVETYWKKFGGPLLDTIGIRIDCNKKDEMNGYTLDELRSMIKDAWEIQYKRQGKLNQDLNEMEAGKFIRLSENARQYLDTINEKYSPRAISLIKKVARTFEDMNTSEVNGEVSESAVKVAVELRGGVPTDNL